MQCFDELRKLWKVVVAMDERQARTAASRKELRKFEQLQCCQNNQYKDIETLKNRSGVLLLSQCFRRAREAAELSAKEVPGAPSAPSEMQRAFGTRSTSST